MEINVDEGMQGMQLDRRIGIFRKHNEAFLSFFLLCAVVFFVTPVMKAVAAAAEPDSITISQIQVVPGRFTYVPDKHLTRELGFTAIPFIGYEHGIENLYYTLERKLGSSEAFTLVETPETDGNIHGFHEVQSSSDCIKKGAFFFNSNLGVLAATTELSSDNTAAGNMRNLKIDVFVISSSQNQAGENGLEYKLYKESRLESDKVCDQASMQVFTRTYITNSLRNIRHE